MSEQHDVLKDILRTTEDLPLDALLESVRRSAYAAGFAEGRDQGFAEGYSKGCTEGHDKGMFEGKKQGLLRATTMAL